MCADSIASGKLSASSRNSFVVMALFSSSSSSVQRHQAHSRSGTTVALCHISSQQRQKSIEQVHSCPDIIRRMAILQVHVVPNARSDVVVGEYGGALKIKLRAQPLEGKANAALLRFLGEQLKLPRKAIVLKSGEKSRDKTILIHGLSKEDVYTRLHLGD